MIRVLDKSVADKIAAGEVIEGPVSIVKELVENSIDSGANSISIEIKKGGKDYIRVTDNGCGIDYEFTEKAFLRHATSKIFDAKDLDSIETLGFRGEALASICAVSTVELITKSKAEDIGTRLMIRGGEVISKERIGAPNGTTIIVEGLFYNVPARSKFLKSDSAESGKIIDLISRIAISHSNINFRLITNGNGVFSTNGRGKLLSTILEVYKQKEFSNLIYFENKIEDVKTFGYISKTDLSRTTRRNQYAFVNGRVIKSKVIDRAIEDGYRERLFEGRYPVAFIFVECPPDSIDVNIHPNKKEVRFHNEDLIQRTVSEGIEKALLEKQAVISVSQRGISDFKPFDFNNDTSETRRDELDKNTSSPSLKGNSDANKHVDFNSIPNNFNDEKFTVRENSNLGFFMNGKIKEKSEQVDIKSILETKRDREKEEQLEISKLEIQEAISITKPSYEPFDFTSLTFTGSIFGTYITAVDEDDFYLIDQHAAHERIFYEDLVGQYNKKEKNRQLILTPILIDCPLEIMPQMEFWIEELEKIGYTVEEFGDNTFLIREIPMFMSLGEAEAFAKSFLDNLGEGRILKNQVVIDKLITKSCKSAVKAHDFLSMEEIDALMKQLINCKNPFSCPHGRPTFIKMSKYQIERMFKRA